jgi:predicted transposase/invertase (TIGR01784 family)
MPPKPLISFDYAIKYLLKNKKDYDIIEGFISAVLQTKGYKSVKIISLLDTESNREHYHVKKSLADLVVEDEDHHQYIIEIERNFKESFVHKSCFNTSRLIVDHLSMGADYTQISKVFHISLLYFTIGNGAIYHGQTLIYDIDSQAPLTLSLMNNDTGECYNAANIFPEFFYIAIPTFNDIINRELDEWLYMLKHNTVPEHYHSAYMTKVAEKLNFLKMSPTEQADYQHYLKQCYDYRDEMQAAIKLAKQDGKLEGKLEVAKKMLSKQQSISDIAEFTGLSVVEIEGLL